LGKALELDPELVLSIAAGAIESVRHQRELVLRVNPEDAALMRNSRKKLMDMLGRTKDIAVREDPEVARGGCIVETENGTVDAQLKTQLQMLELALLGESR
jgi:flagellar biosynthesis/type III secretory pathway protein FliH